MLALFAMTGATATLLWVLAAILVIAGIIALFREASSRAWPSSSSAAWSARAGRASSNSSRSDDPGSFIGRRRPLPGSRPVPRYRPAPSRGAIPGCARGCVTRASATRRSALRSATASCPRRTGGRGRGVRVREGPSRPGRSLAHSSSRPSEGSSSPSTSCPVAVPSPTGASSELAEKACAASIAARTSSDVAPSRSASSWIVGARPSSCVRGGTARFDPQDQLLKRTGHPDGPGLVSEVALQLPHDRGGRIRGEAHARVDIEAIDRAAISPTYATCTRSSMG